MYTTLGALPRASGHGKIPPFVNLQGRQVLATVGNVRRGHLQGLRGLGGSVPAQYIYSNGSNAVAAQAAWDAAQSVAPGFIGPSIGGNFNIPTGYVQIWWPSPAGNYYMLVKQGQIPSMPNGGAVYSYTQAGASAASPQNPSTGFAMVPGISLNGAPAYQAVYQPPGTSQPPPPQPLPAPAVQASQTPSTPPAGLMDSTSGSGSVVPPVTQGPVQSSAPIQATVAMLPAPSVPGMDQTAGAQSTAVAAAINGQNVSATYPAPYQDGGTNWLLWGGIGLAAFLLLRR
jgi:hypothetical protein